ncbi:hypothetical protein [Arthrobacter koreensis]|uniref:hypothetical protein n=1 Tax=Arthrobacter koreensis TaxID=199136 RepID=UPI003817492E
MSAATLTRETATPALFDLGADLEALAAEEARKEARELCQRYLGTWADSYGTTAKRDTTITFAEFQAAAERLSSAA